jgi:hypothetical protein
VLGKLFTVCEENRGEGTKNLNAKKAAKKDGPMAAF